MYHSGVNEHSPESAALGRVAILCGDIASSSRIVLEAGDLAFVGALGEFFQRLHVIHSLHHGLLVKSLGDGFLMAFSEIEDCFEFGVALLRSLAVDPIQVNSDSPVTQTKLTLKLRLSMHVGEVSVVDTPYGRDMFGISVNLAARMTALARPGEMVLSETAEVSLTPLQRSLIVPGGEISEIKGISGRFRFSRVDASEVSASD